MGILHQKKKKKSTITVETTQRLHTQHYWNQEYVIVQVLNNAFIKPMYNWPFTILVCIVFHRSFTFITLLPRDKIDLLKLYILLVLLNEQSRRHWHHRKNKKTIYIIWSDDWINLFSSNRKAIQLSIASILSNISCHHHCPCIMSHHFLFLPLSLSHSPWAFASLYLFLSCTFYFHSILYILKYLSFLLNTTWMSIHLSESCVSNSSTW